MSLASWASCGVGASVMAETDGMETQEGGPKESEYPGRMFVIILCSGMMEGAELGSDLMGESCLLEKVSGMTWSLPGIWHSLYLNINDFSLKFRSLGFGI